LEMARDQREQAEAAFKRAVDADPGSIPSKLALANVYRISGRNSESEAILTGVLTLAPKDIAVNQAMAALYIATNQPKRAEQYLKTVVELSNDDVSRLALG